VHHVELWVPDLHRALASLGWLLEALGYTLFQCWDGGRSWRLGPTYLVIEQSPDLSAEQHDRRPGLNHLAPAGPQVSSPRSHQRCGRPTVTWSTAVVRPVIPALGTE
jgi:hypothetical protein